MIRIEGLTKLYGDVAAIRDVSFGVERGSIVGFLGRNGAGKTTTLRILVGLAEATGGRALIDGVPYRNLEQPVRRVGVAFDAFAFHPRLSGRVQLRAQAIRAGLPGDRVTEVLKMVELAGAGDRRVGTYSLGMRQRLNLACAMLGDPEVLILDEPTNGLDPQGHHWMRRFLLDRADEGRAVLFSSHVLAEVAETVDHVVVIANGRILRTGTLQEVVGSSGDVRVRSERPDELRSRLEAQGATVVAAEHDSWKVSGLSEVAIGEIARDARIALRELTPEEATLEQIFLEMTSEEDGGPS